MVQSHGCNCTRTRPPFWGRILARVQTCPCSRLNIASCAWPRIWNQGVLRLASLSRIRKQSVDSFNRVWNQSALRQASVNLDTYILGTHAATRGIPESPNRPHTAPAVRVEGAGIDAEDQPQDQAHGHDLLRIFDGHICSCDLLAQCLQAELFANLADVGSKLRQTHAGDPARYAGAARISCSSVLLGRALSRTERHRPVDRRPSSRARAQTQTANAVLTQPQTRCECSANTVQTLTPDATPSGQRTAVSSQHALLGQSYQCFLPCGRNPKGGVKTMNTKCTRKHSKCCAWKQQNALIQEAWQQAGSSSRPEATPARSRHCHILQP